MDRIEILPEELREIGQTLTSIRERQSLTLHEAALVLNNSDIGHVERGAIPLGPSLVLDYLERLASWPEDWQRIHELIETVPPLEWAWKKQKEDAMRGISYPPERLPKIRMGIQIESQLKETL